MSDGMVTGEGSSQAVSGQELKKAVEYVHVAGALSLIERKIINVLLLYAYDDLLTREEHAIPLGLLSRLIGWKNYEELKEAIRSIKRVELEFDAFTDRQNRNPEWLLTNPLGEVTFTNGVCIYSYGPRLRAKLKNPDVYALINMKLQREFQSSYGLALYENTVRYKDVGSTGWHTVDEWKGILGLVKKFDQAGKELPSAYDAFKVFNARVIKVAVEDVNTHTPNFEVEADYEKRGREVKRIRFLLKQKTQHDMFEGLSDDEAVLRQSEAWKALESIGCRPTFIKQVLLSHGHEWALSVSEECRAHGVKTPAALAKWFARTGTTPTPRKSKRQTANEDKAGSDDKAGAANSADAMLTDAERAQLAEEFIAKTPGARISQSTGRFGARHLAAFKAYTIERAPQVIAAR